MVNLKKLFSPVESISADQLKAFLAEHADGSYNLLDVRQPSEYEQQHIPGAKLTPLPHLEKTLAEIDPKKPTMVY